GIVLEGSGGPYPRNFGLSAEAELHHEARQHAEEGCAVVEMVLDEVVETIRAQRRPGALDLHREVSLGGCKLRLESGRSLLVKRGGFQQRGSCRGALRCWLCGSLRCRGLAAKNSSDKHHCEKCGQQVFHHHLHVSEVSIKYIRNTQN